MDEKNRFFYSFRVRTLRDAGSKRMPPPAKRRSIWPLRIISEVGRWCSAGGSISATPSQSERAMSSSCVEKRMHLC